MKPANLEFSTKLIRKFIKQDKAFPENIIV